MRRTESEMSHTFVRVREMSQASVSPLHYVLPSEMGSIPVHFRYSLIVRRLAMSNRPWLIAAIALSAVSCGFGHSIQRPNDVTLVENLGANQYTYRLTRLMQKPARGPAAPVLAIPPEGAEEVGLIEVTVDYSGLGTGGLRSSESEFFPTLATIAGELGGTNFLVLRSTRDPRIGQWMTSLTVDVLAAPMP